MTGRWIMAASASIALALLTMNGPLPSLFDAAEAAGAVCEPNGKPADLSFTLKDLNNKDVKLADFKGKVIVLDFWATWCGPCKVEIPAFVDMQAKYGDKGLQVLGFSVDDTLDKLKPFATQFKMNYPVLQGRDRDEVQDAFGPIFGIPTTIVIGRDGKICRRHVGMSSAKAFEDEIKALL